MDLSLYISNHGGAHASFNHLSTMGLVAEVSLLLCHSYALTKLTFNINMQRVLKDTRVQKTDVGRQAIAVTILAIIKSSSTMNASLDAVVAFCLKTVVAAAAASIPEGMGRGAAMDSALESFKQRSAARKVLEVQHHQQQRSSSEEREEEDSSPVRWRHLARHPRLGPHPPFRPLTPTVPR